MRVLWGCNRCLPVVAAHLNMDAGNKEYLNIIACENAIRATSQLKKAVYEKLEKELDAIETE